MPFDEHEPESHDDRPYDVQHDAQDTTQRAPQRNVQHDVPEPIDDTMLEEEMAAARESRALLQPLRLDPVRFETLVQRIEAAAANELLDRATSAGHREPSYLSLATQRAHTMSGGLTGDTRRLGTGRSGMFANTLSRAAWPALATAAAAVLVAFTLTRGTTTRQSTTSDYVAGRILAASATTRALAVRTPDATWIAQQTTPSSDDLAQAIGLGVEQ